jgi:hypothetical protein
MFKFVLNRAPVDDGKKLAVFPFVHVSEWEHSLPIAAVNALDGE